MNYQMKFRSDRVQKTACFVLAIDAFQRYNSWLHVHRKLDISKPSTGGPVIYVLIDVAVSVKIKFFNFNCEYH